MINPLICLCPIDSVSLKRLTNTDFDTRSQIPPPPLPHPVAVNREIMISMQHNSKRKTPGRNRSRISASVKQVTSKYCDTTFGDPGLYSDLILETAT